jgi:hypothetical protein
LHSPPTARRVNAGLAPIGVRVARVVEACSNSLADTAKGRIMACAEMYGARKRLPAQQSGNGGGSSRRPWGYDVPDGIAWQGKVDARLGIQP